MKIVLCYSGGLDSTVLLYDLKAQGHEAVPLGFKYGQRHVRELNAAYEVCHTLGLTLRVMEVNWAGVGGSILKAGAGELTGTDTVVPLRNHVFLTVAAALAMDVKAEAVAIAAHQGDRAVYADCREEFFAEFDALLRATYSGAPKILRPFISMTKEEIVKRGQMLSVPFWKTWSCYEGHALPCGKCGACTERAMALGEWEDQGMTFAKLRASATAAGPRP